ncbi:LLM class flavin-dependent oxidoreductase [Capillimicrobium parvum]|nr:LLM class flavin-dependent oxidoreductase [Capillimicrobium parvum]
MIEVGIFDGGSSDLPFRKTASGQRIVDGTLADVHDAARRTQAAQVRRAVLAESVGFDYYWLTEHHFGTEGAELSTNPLQIGTAIAALTRTIRIGQLANIVAFHHPIRLAEQIAILDNLSGGRAEVGLGRGYQGREAEMFGKTYGAGIQDQERNRSFHHEAYEILIKAWTEESFSHTGQFFSIPPDYTKWNHAQTIAFFEEGDAGPDVNDVFKIAPPDQYSMMGPPISASGTTLKQLSVMPQPFQKPHPPLWEPLNSERTIRWAASKGLNGNFIFESDRALKPKLDVYMEQSAASGWPNGGEFKYGWDAEKHRGVSSGRVVHIVDPSLSHCNPDLARESQLFQWDFYKPFGFTAILAEPGETPRMDVDVTAEVLEQQGMLIVGSKEHVIEKLMGLKETAYADGDFITNIWFESGGTPHEAVEEQIQFFGEEIIPELRRNCGGSPERAESTVQLVPDAVAAKV